MQIKLNFDLNGYENRKDFLESYIKDNANHLTKDNLEMMANYLLWAVENETGEDFQIKNTGPWKSKEEGSRETSWEGLQERAEVTGMPVESIIAEVQVPKRKAKLMRSEVRARLGITDDWKEEVTRLVDAYDWTASKGCEATFAGKGVNGKVDDNANDNVNYNAKTNLNCGKDETIEDCPIDCKANRNVDCNLTCGKDIPIEQWRDIMFGENRHPTADTWFDLWKRIDETEFKIQVYELVHGKRRPDLPIREELYHRIAFSIVFDHAATTLQSKVQELEQEAEQWDGKTYLKERRRLVDLRTQQYALLDVIKDDPIQQHINPGHYYGTPDYGIGEIYPFIDERLLISEVTERCFSREFQDICINALKRCDAYDQSNAKSTDQSDYTYSAAKANNNHDIDLRDMDILRPLLLSMPQLKGVFESAEITQRELFFKIKSFLDYYIKKCDFSEELLFIFKNKINGASNKQIADGLREHFNLSYQENYISTIFTKRILASLKEQIDLHYKLIEYCTIGKTIFKRCSVCGKLLPRNNVYFNKRTSTSDGFFSYCKKCKKMKDLGKKVKENDK